LRPPTRREAGENAAETPEAVQQTEPARDARVRQGQIWAPGEGDHFWVFPESKETLGSGGPWSEARTESGPTLPSISRAHPLTRAHNDSKMVHAAAYVLVTLMDEADIIL
jgi:hypothetical protein